VTTDLRPASRGLPYHLILLGGRPGWWRPVVGILALVVGAGVLAPALVSIPFVVGLAATGHSGSSV
jgi:uncharacterized protein